MNALRGTCLTVALGLLASCQQSSTTPSAVAKVATIPADQVMYGLHHVITKGGVRSSVLDGDTAYVREDGRILDLVGVRLTFYTATGTESGTLTSREGEYDINGGLFVARKDVVLVTRGPGGTRRIQSDELSYQVKSDELWTDRPFVMTQDGRTTRGTSFRSDGKFQNWSGKQLQTSGGLPQQDAGVSF